MKKYMKYAFYTLLAVVTLSAILIVIVVATVNPNEYKPLLIKIIQRTQHRTLTLKGNITLTFFPELEIKLGKASLSERNNHHLFASVNNVQIYVAPLPLLRNELVVNRIRIDGLHAHVIRYRNGATNIDDWLRPQPDHNRDAIADQHRRLRVDIRQITISQATLTFKDRQNGKKFTINHLMLTADRLADRAPGTINLSFKFINNDTDLAVRLRSDVFFDLATMRYQLQNLTADVNGHVMGIQHAILRFRGNLDADLAHKSLHLADLMLKATGQCNGNISLALDAPRLEIAQRKATSGPITITADFKRTTTIFSAKFTTHGLDGSAKTLDIRQADLSLDGKIAANTVSGTLSTPLAINLATKQITLPRWIAQLTVHNARLPGGKSAIHLQGNGWANLAGKTAHVQFSGTFDRSTLHGTATLSHINPPTYLFNLAIDRLDLDRYIPRQPKKTTAPQKLFNYAILRRLNANGKVRIGTLTLSNVKANNVQVDIQTRQGKLRTKPITAYRGPGRTIEETSPTQASRNTKKQR